MTKTLDSLAAAIVSAIEGALSTSKLSNDELAEACEFLNAQYRLGSPLVTDARYDKDFVAVLRERNPDHPFLKLPEPEPEAVFGDRYRHTVAMLSTDKAYTQAEVAAWVKRAESAARELGIDPATLEVRVTPKLDGIAINDYGADLVTRGSNGYGQRVTGILDKGVVFAGERVGGPGEMVVEQKFFDENIAQQFQLEHPRNFCAGIAGAETLSDYHRVALSAGVVRIVPYKTLAGITVAVGDFAARWESLMDSAQSVPYLCDGAVAELTDERVKAQLGATSHHHRWMVALKRNEATAEAEVLSVRLTTGRTGRITPTLMIAPVKMYGVTISAVTAHTAKHLSDLGIGVGAKVVITRAGGVIPKVLKVSHPVAQTPDISRCPCCGGETAWEGGTYLICPNTATCPDQSSNALQHFFEITRVKGFGPSVCDALVKAGITNVRQVYGLDVEGFAKTGISAGVAKNLVAELERSRKEPISGEFFLGAFGIRHCGRGDSRKILAHVAIDKLDTLTVEQLQSIPGFGEGTSQLIVDGIKRVWPLISSMLALGFTLEATGPAVEAAGGNSSLPLSGKTIVFTGTMVSGSRDDMEAGARKLGATVGGSVSKNTSYLVTGANVGATKTDKAAKLGVKVISENDYLALIGAAA